jgi:cation diffusion facilitator CzcD-associated flavoprotein CzcO
LLLTRSWYPALTQPNVELVGEGLEHVDTRTVVGTGGTAREVDAIVFATGFSPTDPPIAHAIRGPGGRTLADSWGGSPEAYLGTVVAGFPNMFLLYRPNTNTGRCASWYLDANGGNPIMWPDFTFRFRRLAARFDLEEHSYAKQHDWRGPDGTSTSRP